MKRVKCRSDKVTVFPVTGGHYQQRIEEVTIGNVYEVIRVVRDDYYEILPDEGFQTKVLPDYMFESTNEPVTINPDREKNEKKRQERLEKERKEREAQRIREEIQDRALAYYNPVAWYKKQKAKKRLSDALSQIFTSGLPYG